MQIGSSFSMMSGAQVAPRPLAAQTPSALPSHPASAAAGTGDINSLLAYAKAASLQAAKARGFRPQAGDPRAPGTSGAGLEEDGAGQGWG